MAEKKYKIQILSPAQKEIEEIAKVYLSLSGAGSARKITDTLYTSIGHLSDHPMLGVDCVDKPLKLQGYRMLISGNYICIYRVIEDTVFVYHVADGRTDYKKITKDLKEPSI
jgi:plasmid stabilization system protein ParE